MDHRAAINDKAVGLGGGGCHLATVMGRDYSGLGVPVQQKTAAAEPGGVGLNQSEHQMRRDGGIDGIAARTQHLQSSLGGEWIGGRDYELVSMGQRLILPDHSSFLGRLGTLCE
jgi:hypothetical protein